ncbi:MAG: hypothetical protein QY318_03300 [Candidatus Dojkabacteria bacterium]|nr:MAG: hypothetical protein QY318_03300 [Candidatus Dojkabacteria bacterium]
MRIYTASFGGYEGEYKGADLRFSEDNNPFSGCEDHLSNRMKAKLYKVLNPYSYDVWVDANMEILNSSGFKKLMGDSDLAVFRHPFHKNVGEEIEACHAKGLLDNVSRQRVEELYKSASLNISKVPLYACGVLFRSEGCRKLNELWWSLICLYGSRDQITFPYALSMYNSLKVHIIEYDIFDNPYFLVHQHKK